MKCCRENAKIWMLCPYPGFPFRRPFRRPQFSKDCGRFYSHPFRRSSPRSTSRRLRRLFVILCQPMKTKNNVIPLLLSKLSRDLVSEVMKSSTTPCVITRFFYPNGDSIVLYFSKKSGKVTASDLGSTIDALVNSGVNLTARRRQIIEGICQGTGMKLSGDCLGKTIRNSHLNDDVLQLCQSLTHVSSLHYYGS